jgi:hypothetical protein
MTTSDRIPLTQVRGVLNFGHPLPFRVLDAQQRLLLNEGQVLLDEVQFDVLVERGAWAERSLVDAVRKARAAASQPPIVAQISLFDRWERLSWRFDKLSRGLVRHEVSGSAIAPFSPLCKHWWTAILTSLHSFARARKTDGSRFTHCGIPSIARSWC